MCYFINVIFATVLTAAVVNFHILGFGNPLDAHNHSTLVLVHGLFRHGNRTIDPGASYPKDPYINETYYPFGFGQLTNKGKRTEYFLGKVLRARYKHFLGNLYTPELLDPVSSEYNRTKMSLELVLAGMFPPQDTLLEWDKDLNWSPVPYNYRLFEEDNHLLSIPFFYCPNFVIAYEEYLSSLAGLEEQQKYKKLFEYLTEHTGLNIKSLLDVFSLYVTLVAQDDWGFKLPSWTKKVYPNVLEETSGQLFSSTSSTQQLRQLSGGFLLKKIVDDTQAFIDGKLSPRGRKLFLYSAHDVNVAYLLCTLEVFTPHEPPYGSYVLIEVHKTDDIYGIKIFYQDYSQPEPKLLKVPGCDLFCPFEEFVTLLKDNLPSDDDACGDGDSITLKKYMDKKMYI